MLLDKPLSFDSLTYEDLKTGGVFEFLLEGDTSNDNWVTPVTDIPVTDLDFRVVVNEVELACGQKELAILGNLDLRDPELNQHFLVITFVADSGVRFRLARYHDSDYETQGPKTLAKYFGLHIDEVFPIKFDISAFAQGVPECVRGEIEKEAKVTLSEEDLLFLAFGK